MDRNSKMDQNPKIDSKDGKNIFDKIEFLDIKWHFTSVYKTGGIVFFKLLGKNVLRRATYIISLSNEFEVE